MLYFAYGSNLHLERILARCPGAKPYSRATLRFWRLTYKANFSGNGVATIERNKVRRGAVYGALYTISDKELAILDRFEGTPTTYQRYKIMVETPLGNREAIVYIMNDHFKYCKPNPKYLNVIMKGYKQWGLPLSKLVTTPTEQELRKTKPRTLCFEESDPMEGMVDPMDIERFEFEYFC